MALIDGFVVISAMFVFDIESGLYALVGLFATSKTIDLVQVGLNQSKTVFIISENQEAIRQAILFKIDRGITGSPQKVDIQRMTSKFYYV